MTDNTSKNDLICKKCNTEYKVKNNNKDYDCTPEQCSIIEICEGCDRYINCHRENLHILTKQDKYQKYPDDLTYCCDCCQDRDEEMLNEGWKCDECDEDDEDDEDDDE